MQWMHRDIVVRLFRYVRACSLGLTALLSISLAMTGRADTKDAGAPTVLKADRVTSSITVPDFSHLNRTESSLLLQSSPLKSLSLTSSCGGQVVGANNRISPYPIALRLGAMLSPRSKFDGGADITFPNLTVIRGMTSRLDVDAIVAANLGGLSTIVPITFDQIGYSGEVGSKRIYFGAGIGAYISDVTRFGGKVFAGADFSSHFGLEVTGHFSGWGDTLLTVQTRFPF
jgi:hypothetical protein